MATYLRELIKRHDVATVVDVGANRGQYRDLLRHGVAYEGRIISFEPLSHLAHHLRQRAVLDPLWVVRNEALGRSKGTKEINVMAFDQTSSFMTPTDNAPEGHTVVSTEPVKVTTLDSLFAEKFIDTSRGNLFLKMDTQGYDLEVLRGCEQNLAGIIAVQTELAFRPNYEDMATYTVVLDYMRDKGFVIGGFFPVSHNKYMRLVEADCILINSALCVG